MTETGINPIGHVLARFEGVRRSGSEYAARCPTAAHAHGDRMPSLTIRGTKDGKVLVTCHRGCSTEEVLAAAGLTMADLFTRDDDAPAARPQRAPGGSKIETTYDYTDAEGRLVMQVVRMKPKEFRQRRPDGKGGWVWKLDGLEPPLYRLPAVLEAVRKGEPVVVVEGEKDADTLIARGYTATTNPGGAGKWRRQHTEALRNAVVSIVADADDPGRAHARAVAAALAGVAKEVTTMEPAPGYKDITAHVFAGHTMAELAPLPPPPSPVTGSTNRQLVGAALQSTAAQIMAAAMDANLSGEEAIAYCRRLLTGVGEAPLEVANLHEVTEFVDISDPEYDWLIPGLLERQDRVIVVAKEGNGKRLRVDEPVPTPDGWTSMGLLAPGDTVFGRDGRPCTVTAVSEVEPNPDAWAVEFSDGTVVEADADHQWVTVDYRARQADHEPGVRTTEEIRQTLHARGGHTRNHAVPVAAPLDLPPADLPLPPYTLGIWLAEGSSAASVVTLNRQDAPSIEECIRADGVDCHRTPSGERPGSVNVWLTGWNPWLRALGLLGAKTIPDAYLRASIDQRRALLAGLLDGDGWIIAGAAKPGRGHGRATCELTFTTKGLIEPTAELIRSLGIKVTVAESDAMLEGRVVGRRWRMTFASPFNPFRTPRKADRWVPLRTRRSQYRYITDVRRAEPTPMRCISVDSPDNTYLAGRAMIPTHNSSLARFVALMAAQGMHPFTLQPMKPIRSLIVDLENPARAVRRDVTRLVDRLLTYTGERYGLGQAYIWTRPEGIDLRSDRGAALLTAVIEEVRPDLVCLGPLYKAYKESRDKPEQVAAEAAQVLDDLRAKYRLAWWLEQHAPISREAPTAKDDGRDLRPMGSGLWTRWPEFGLVLRKEDKDSDGRYILGRFRGDRDRNRAWPSNLYWGKQWPWEAAWEGGMPRDDAWTR